MNDAPQARVDAERNRRMLLDAASGALEVDPDASLAQVARIAGLARATLYRHFGSREQLLAALRGDALGCARTAIVDARVDEGAAVEALHRVVAGIVSFGGRFRPLLTDVLGRDPEFLRQRKEVFGPIVATIQRGQASGEIRTDVSAQWIVTALTALLASAVRMERGVAEPETVEMVLGILFRGVQQPHGLEN